MVLRPNPEIGRPLDTFKNSRELVTVFSDAMKAYKECTRYKTNFGGPQISAKNILITSSGRGLLVDLELFQGPDISPNPKMRQLERKYPGTHQFMSTALLTNPKHCHDYQDDIESAFHVLVWSLLRYTLHNKLDDLHSLMRMFDDGRDKDVTGDLKLLFLTLRVRFLAFSNPLLTELVQELALTFSVRYEPPPDQELLAFFQSAAGSKITQNPIVRRKSLEDQWWLVNTIQKYLKDESKWPKKDVAYLNNVLSPRETARARKKAQLQNNNANCDADTTKR